MHKTSFDEMGRWLGAIWDSVPESAVVVDVGSQNINGSYRALIPTQHKYIGVDRVAGRNVDVVMTSEYESGLEAGIADIVISGNCFEHVRNPFRLMREVARITKPGGYVCIGAPFVFQEHRFPIDCWRFLPDGTEKKTFVMNEIWRVLKPGGIADIDLPAFPFVQAVMDPTHLSFWCRESFWYYENGNRFRDAFASRTSGPVPKFDVIESSQDGWKLKIKLRAVKS